MRTKYVVSWLIPVLLVGGCAETGPVARPVEPHPVAEVTAPPQPAQPVPSAAPAQSAQPAQPTKPTPSVSAVADAPVAAGVPLRWNWGNGQRVTYRLKLEQFAENDTGTLKERSEGGTEFLATFEGADLTDKGAHPVRFTFGELFTHEFNLGVKKDTRSTPIEKGQKDNMRNCALRALVGEGGVALIEANGTIPNVLEMQNAYQGARNRVKNGDIQAWVDQMFKFFNPDNMRFNLSTVFACVPGEERPVGARWESSTFRDSSAGALAFRRVWTLDSIVERDGRRFALLTGVTKVSLPENTGLLSAFYRSTVTRGDGTARVEFDLERGIIARATLETVVEFENVAKPDRDPVKYKPYKQSVRDVMTLTLEGFGDTVKTFEKDPSPGLQGPLEPDAG